MKLPTSLMSGTRWCVLFLFLGMHGTLAGCNPEQEASRAREAAPQAGSESPSGVTSVSPLKRPIVEPGKHYTARIVTDRGAFIIELFSQAAPYTVSNFIHLAEAGFYAGLTFFKVVPGYVAQAGDPTGTGRGGPGYTFLDERNSRLHHRGAISMANAGRPDSNGSQFFICLRDLPSLNGHHTVFGRVVQGLDVVDQLTSGDSILQIEITAE